MKTETREVFVADDGKVFDKAEDCMRHEMTVKEHAKQIEAMGVYVVDHSFDLTEGRGFFGLTILVTDATYNEILQYCIDRYGHPLCDFYGRDQPAWHLNRKTAQTGDGWSDKRWFEWIEDMKRHPPQAAGSSKVNIDVVFLTDKKISHPSLPTATKPGLKRRPTEGMLSGTTRLLKS